MSFKDKVVIVTSASSGIGAVTAAFFTREGAYVTIVGRNETKLREVMAHISTIGEFPLVLKADVSKEEDAKSIIDQTVSRFGKIDVLVNNAGIYRKKTVYEEGLLEIYDEVMTSNLRSVVHLTILAAPHLVKTHGNIVNISSIAGKSPMAPLGRGFSAYCTSKAALDHFSRAIALELADKGVRVNIVSPGPVHTDIFEDAGLVQNDDNDGATQHVVDQTPLKVFTMPEEVADMVLYLASDKARSVTGSDFLIDNGALLKF